MYRDSSSINPVAIPIKVRWMNVFFFEKSIVIVVKISRIIP